MLKEIRIIVDTYFDEALQTIKPPQCIIITISDNGMCETRVSLPNTTNPYEIIFHGLEKCQDLVFVSSMPETPEKTHLDDLMSSLNLPLVDEFHSDRFDYLCYSSLKENAVWKTKKL